MKERLPIRIMTNAMRWDLVMIVGAISDPEKLQLRDFSILPKLCLLLLQPLARRHSPRALGVSADLVK